MTISTPTEEKPSAYRQAIDPLVDDLTVYHDVGLDTDGRAYFYAARAHEIVVTATDRRGKGVRNSDIITTIGLGSDTVDDYCRFVRDASEREWAACGWMGWR